MNSKTTNISLTKSQIDNLIDFIEINFIQSIRNDEYIDNIDYIKDMMDTLTTLRLAHKAMLESEEVKK